MISASDTTVDPSAIGPAGFDERSVADEDMADDEEVDRLRMFRRLLVGLDDKRLADWKKQGKERMTS